MRVVPESTWEEVGTYQAVAKDGQPWTIVIHYSGAKIDRPSCYCWEAWEPGARSPVKVGRDVTLYAAVRVAKRAVAGERF